MIKRNIGRIVLVSLLVMLMVIGQTAAQIRFITIATGPVGGEWYVLGGILSEILKPALPGIKVTATTGGGIANISTVASGKSDIGTTQDQLLYDARRGLEDYAEQGPVTNVVGLAYLADIYMSVFLVREEMDIDSIEDIVSKEMPIRILTAPKGSTPSRATERMLAEYGITADLLKSWGGQLSYVSYADASSMIRDGHADAYCGPIMPAIIELTVSRNMKMLPVKESVLEAMNEKHAYGRAVLPEGIYDFVTADTPVMTESPILVVRDDIPEDVVYNITKAIAENADKIKDAGRTYTDFKAEVMPNINAGPIHPGALKYYREVGWVE